MANTTVLVFSVNPADGSNKAVLGVQLADAQGNFSIRLSPVPSGPVRLLADGGTYASEMNGATVSWPSDVAALLPSATSNIAGISINPVADFVNSLTVGKLKSGSVTFTNAYSSAVATIESLYALTSDPARTLPSYAPAAVGTNAGNLGLVLGALINEDQNLCPSWPGGLVAALSADIADGIFDARDLGAPIAYCGTQLTAIAGTADFQDALAGISQLELITRAFAFGGTGNVLTANGLANVALGGSQRYPLGPLASIDAGVVKAAPKAQNTFAPPAATATMNAGRGFATATLLPGGKVLIAGGGSTPGVNNLSSAELYDAATNSFSLIAAAMNTGRQEATATPLQSGKVLIAGGSDAIFDPFSVTILASTELYNPLNNTFASRAGTAKMNVARQQATATLLPDGKVLIAGGFDVNGMALASTELYDPATNTFAPPAGTAKMNATRVDATATLLPNGKVLIAGGFDINETPLASTELYDPATNTFAAATPSMHTTHASATATLLPNGKVLIAGGYALRSTGGFKPTNSTELYDPATNTFALPTGTATMNGARAQAVATLLANGKVLIAGGFGPVPFGLTALMTTELYDPATSTFAGVTATMNEEREGSTISLLANGKVLIAGRDGGESTTELYSP